MGWGRKGDDGERRSWHGMNQPKPKLPYYFRTSKRLKSLDEFERPEWKGRVKFDDDRVTLKGVARETAQWLLIFALAGVIVGACGLWLSGGTGCLIVAGGFKIGWC